MLALNPKLTCSSINIGAEHVPVWILDDVILAPEQLVELASEQDGIRYKAQSSDFYPGIRKAAPNAYQHLLVKLFNQLILGGEAKSSPHVLMSAFSIANTPVSQLRPIQMLPHFDTPDSQQFAVVHYLCDATHGGTAWYRHRNTGYERITTDRLVPYNRQIKQQAIAENIHLNPHYINHSTALFEQIHSVEAKFNRAVIYPSNALHSGNIQADKGLCADPKKGRLTVSSFVSMVY